ncbi:MAG: UDP-glucose--hexose-1-phosphate uridylyltransferase [Omnitrophica WOR_2 bacterium]
MESTLNLDRPHLRLNALTHEWVLVSPHRARRPWQGQVEKQSPENLPRYDPACYLCPGNTRAEGVKNPLYTSTYVFENDFPALFPADGMGEDPASTDKETPSGLIQSDLFTARPAWGLCRVVCFSPRHDLTLATMQTGDVEAVVRAWIEQTRDLSQKDFIQYVQVFENRTAMMGASSPHPHSQIWATSDIPNEPAKELKAQTGYLQQHHSCLLCDYLQAEKTHARRLVTANEHFTALVPFWAVWPFEILLASNQHYASLPDMTSEEITGLADILRKVTARYDNLFEVTFPYSMGFHQAPSDGDQHPEWHFHAHYYPPLLRSATVRKFMVGFELLGEPQRDLTPETAAERLRSLSEKHYQAG